MNDDAMAQVILAEMSMRSWMPGFRAMPISEGATNDNLTVTNGTLAIELSNVPEGAVFGLHCDNGMLDWVGSKAPSVVQSASDTSIKVFGLASRAYNGSQHDEFADNDAFEVLDLDFIFTLRVKFNALGTIMNILGKNPASISGTNASFYLYKNSDNTVRFSLANGSTLIECVSPAITTTNFVEISFGRTGNFIAVGVNGAIGTPVSFTGTVPNVANPFVLGRAGDATVNHLNGNIDEVLLAKNSPMHLTNYVIETKPFAYILCGILKKQVSTIGLDRLICTPQFARAGIRTRVDVCGDIIRSNTATGGDSNYITLDAGASSVNDFYNGSLIVLDSGSGAHQTRMISSYNGATKQAYVTDEEWVVAPADGDEFSIYEVVSENVQSGFSLRTINPYDYPTLIIITSLEKGTGTTDTPIMGVPLITSIGNPADNKIVKASNELQLSWDTERVGLIGTWLKIAQFIPDFDGTVKIELEIKDSASTNRLCRVMCDRGPTSAVSNSPGVLTTNGGGDFLALPICSSLSIVNDSYTLFDAATTPDYVKRSEVINVRKGHPVVITLQSGSTTSFKNVRAYWTEIIGTEATS